MEVKNAIERCNQLIKVEHANWIGISNQTAISTVLDELEFYKEQCTRISAQRVMTSLEDSKKAKEDLEMLNDGWKIELEKKDKIINEMAKYIKEPYQLYLFKGRMTKMQAIIEYFTKKVEG